MARLMLSFGMFSALAAAMALRKRGLPSGSPPDLAAMLISLMSCVKILPRLASSAPFLCLIVAHLEWPDMGTSVVIENTDARASALASIPLQTLCSWCAGAVFDHRLRVRIRGKKATMMGSEK